MSWEVYNSDGQLLQATDLPDDAVTISKLSATGTANNSTFLRGDNTWAAPSGGPSQANQNAIEAETNQDTYVPPDLIKHSPGVAKAWCKFNGTSSGPITNDQSYNCDATTDSGTGLYTVNFTTNFSSAHPAVVAGGNALHHVEHHAAAAGTYSVKGLNSSHAVEDAARMYLIAFGDQ